MLFLRVNDLKNIFLTFENQNSSFSFLIPFMKDLDAIKDDLMELKPTLLVGVPRVFEKIHEGTKAMLIICSFFTFRNLVNKFKLSNLYFRNQTSCTSTQSSEKEGFWFALQIVNQVLSSFLLLVAYFLHDSCKIRDKSYICWTCSKLSWMNSGYKQKDASPLADLLAFRKVETYSPS